MFLKVRVMLKENYSQFVWNSILENWDRTVFTNYESVSYTYAEVGRTIYYLQKLFHKCGLKKEKNCANW